MEKQFRAKNRGKYKKTAFQNGLTAGICFLAVLCVSLCLPIKSIAAKAAEKTYTENGYEYEIFETAGGEKYASVSSYLGNEVNLIVPDSLGGCPVREVALGSRNISDIARYEQIQSVVFPQTMVNLNAAACMYFSGLTSVVIPEGTEFVGPDAFYGCLNLTDLAIPASVTSFYGAISNNDNLNYHVQNGSYADKYFTESGNEVIREGEKIPVTNIFIEGQKESGKKLEFTKPSNSRIVCLAAELSPAGASERRIKWEVDNAQVIQFDDGAGFNNGGSKIYFTVKKGGKVKVTAVSEDGGYTARCEIDAVVDISCQKISLAKNSFEYDGTAKCPQVIVEGLREGIDYTVAYGGNIAVGTGTVMISGVGANTGRVTKSFAITPQKQNPSSGANSNTIQKSVSVKKPAKFQVINVEKQKAKLTWKPVKDADGYEIYRSAKQKGKYKKIKTIKKGSSSVFKNGKLKKKRRYFYKIRAYRIVRGKKCRSPFARVKSVKIKI